MIAGHLNNLKLATLPDTLYTILSSAELSLNALQNQADGRYQMEGEQWFYTIGDVGLHLGRSGTVNFINSF